MNTTSDRRLAANRANAKRSTGPRTPAGKAIVALNAMKHGLYSEVVLAGSEREADLVAFGRKLRADLAPVGELELMLADKIVATAWRLRRLAGIEASLFKDEAPGKAAHAFLGYGGEGMLRLSRHETTLERTLYRALNELERVQAKRQGEAVLPPAVLEVHLNEASDTPADTGEGLALFRQNNQNKSSGAGYAQTPSPTLLCEGSDTGRV